MPDDAVYVGRGSPLGNPFRREQFGDDAIGLYRRWLAIVLGKLSADAAMRGVEDVRARWLLADARPNDPRAMIAMRSIGEATLLVCSCKSSTGDYVQPVALPIVVLDNGSAYLDVVISQEVGLSGVNYPAAQDNVVLRVPESWIDSVHGNRARTPSLAPAWKLHLKSGVEAFAFLPLIEMSEELSVDVRWALGPVSGGSGDLLHPLKDRLVRVEPSSISSRLEALAAERPIPLSRSGEGALHTIGAQSTRPREHLELQLLRMAADSLDLNAELLGYPAPTEVRIPLAQELGLTLGPLHSLLIPPIVNVRRCHGDVVASAWQWLRHSGRLAA